MGPHALVDPRGLRMFRLEHGSWRDLGRLTAQSWLPLDGERLLLDQPTAAIFTDHGTTPTDLHPRAWILAVTRTTDGVFWLLATGGRVYSSTDALHWTLQA